MDSLSFGGGGGIFCHYFTKSQVSMAKPLGATKDGAKAFLDQIMTKMMTKSPFFSEPLYVQLLAWLPYCKNFDPLKHLLATCFNEHQ
jgi:hypothetical protein